MVNLPPLKERAQELTLGGLRPGSIVCIVPGDQQRWWKPCLRRSEGSTDTHAWYLAPTSDGSIHCWDCRRSIPRVVMGPRASIEAIRKALERGDFAQVEKLVRALSWTSAPSVTVEVAPPTTAFQPRDRADWEEFFCERAAIFEYLGGHHRSVAEAKARELAGPAP